MLVLGVDGATWDIIKPNIDQLPNFKKLVKENDNYTIHLKQKPWSASVWCSMFSGKTPEEHNHLDFVKDGKVQTREDVNVDFIWDLMRENKKTCIAINIPFIVPPFSFGTKFICPGAGVPITDDENREEIGVVYRKIKSIKENINPDLLIGVFTALDKMSHMHWGEDVLLDFYKKVDEKLGELVKLDDQVLIISDHGFCDYDKAPIQTLPNKTSDGHELKGDHHPDAILIAKNIPFKVDQPADVFKGLKDFFGD